MNVDQRADDLTSQPPADGAESPRVWTGARIVLVLVAIAMLAVTIGVYLRNNTLDPELIVPHKLAALAVFAVLGGVGYRLSGRVGERLLVVIAALSAAAVVLMAVSSSPALEPKQIHLGYLASQGIIALVFVLAGLCIFGGWIYFGFFRTHPQPKRSAAE